MYYACRAGSGEEDGESEEAEKEILYEVREGKRAKYMEKHGGRREAIGHRRTEQEADKRRERNVAVINEARRFQPPNDSRRGNVPLLKQQDK